MEEMQLGAELRAALRAFIGPVPKTLSFSIIRILLMHVLLAHKTVTNKVPAPVKVESALIFTKI